MFYPSQQLASYFYSCSLLVRQFVPGLQGACYGAAFCRDLFAVEGQHWNYFVASQHYHFVSFVGLIYGDIPEGN